MSLREVLGILRHRWRVSAIVLALTLGAGWLVAHPTPTYVAKEVFAVQPPASPQLPNQLNNFRPSLAITAAMVAKRLNNPGGQAQMKARGVVGNYELVPRNSGTVQNPAYIIPSIEAQVTAGDRGGALHSVAILVDAFRDELAAIQDELDVASNQRIALEVLAPASAHLLLPSKVRALAAVGLLGLAGSILLSLWYDQLRRRGRRSPIPQDRKNGRKGSFLAHFRLGKSAMSDIH